MQNNKIDAFALVRFFSGSLEGFRSADFATSSFRILRESTISLEDEERMQRTQRCGVVGVVGVVVKGAGYYVGALTWGIATRLPGQQLGKGEALVANCVY